MSVDPGSDSDSESGSVPPSIISMLPGSSYFMRIPGSGILVTGENIVRNAVGHGLRWLIGNTSLSQDLISEEEHRISQNYNELRTAVQELVDMFDQQSSDAYEDEDFNSVDLLRATKVRVEKLESELRLEQEARRKAEARIRQLEHNKTELETTTNQRQRLEEKLRELETSSSSLDSSLDNSHIDEIRSDYNDLMSTRSGQSLPTYSEGGAMLAMLRDELDTERQLRERAEMRLTAMREMHENLVHEHDVEVRAEQARRQLRHLSSGESHDDAGTEIVA